MGQLFSSNEKPASSSSIQYQSLHPPTSPDEPFHLPPKPTSTSSKPVPQARPATSSYKPDSLPPKPSSTSSKPVPGAHPATYSYKPDSLTPKPTSTSSKPGPPAHPFNPLSSFNDNIPTYPPKPPPSFPQPATSLKPTPSFKPTLSPASSSLTNQQTKASYVWVHEDTSPIYVIPEHIENLIKRNEVPEVLKTPLSPSTYKDYFAALLNAEDLYYEKWSEFKLENITLKLQDAEIKNSSRNENFSETNEKGDKTFVEFEIDSCRERRPFLLSRDFAFARPSGQKTEPYQGIIYRVVKSTLVLVEFGEDFLLQHHSTRKYDVSFSFNRVCLKRAHQAIEAASDPFFRSFLFPDFVPRKIIPTSAPLHFYNDKLDAYHSSAVREILSLQGPPPYLIEGPLCSEKYSKQLSRTGLVVQEAVQQIYRSSSKHRILICAPINRTCDVLIQGLKNDIPESDMFRANAAFREIDGVPIDILPSCVYEGECFTCPSIQELGKFRVILSTFVSSFRLHNEGIAAGHFSHIFLVDASSATEPEAMVALANLAGENTAVIVTGEPGNQSSWVRSDIARGRGLRRSYFERLRDSKPESKPVDTYGNASFSYD